MTNKKAISIDNNEDWAPKHFLLLATDIVSYSKRKTPIQRLLIQEFVALIHDAIEVLRTKCKAKHPNSTQLFEQMILLQTGDGIIAGIPFAPPYNLHLGLAKEVFSQLRDYNLRFTSSCDEFNRNGHCLCHEEMYSLRIGLSSGPCLLFKDISHSNNIAGKTVNDAARAMSAAEPWDVLFTEQGMEELKEFSALPNNTRFLQCDPITIKGRNFNFYRFAEIHSPANGKLSAGSESLPIPSNPPSSIEIDIPSIKTTISSVKKKSLEIPCALPVIDSNKFYHSLTEFIQTEMHEVSASLNPQFANSNSTINTLFIHKVPVTQELYTRILNNKICDSNHKKPIESITWEQAAHFCNALSELAGMAQIYKAGYVVDYCQSGFRLLDEIEWNHLFEQYYGEINKESLPEMAWFTKNSKKRTNVVGLKPDSKHSPVIYDLIGNIWEWNNDWWRIDDESSSNSSQLLYKVIKGGSWLTTQESLLNSEALRKPRQPYRRSNDIGFRILLQTSKC